MLWRMKSVYLETRSSVERNAIGWLVSVPSFLSGERY